VDSFLREKTSLLILKIDFLPRCFYIKKLSGKFNKDLNLENFAKSNNSLETRKKFFTTQISMNSPLFKMTN